MSPWWPFIIMAGLAVVLLVRPLLRRERISIVRARYDLQVYREQLKELAVDQERGLISEDEYQASSTEIERRILAAGGARDLAVHTPPKSGQGVWSLVLILALMVPFTGGALYQKFGSPQLPDQPLAGRNNASEAQVGSEFDKAIASLVSRLEENPNDVEGWTLLARSYAFTRRFDEAVGAYREAAALSPNDNDIVAAIGETIVFSRDGMVTPAARQQFELVLARDPGHQAARYYIGLSRAQSGASEEARAIWSKLVAEVDPSEAWLPQLQSQLQALGGDTGIQLPNVASVGEEPRSAASVRSEEPPGPSAADIEAAGEMSAGDRANMIQSMVERLAARLEESPDDIQGWKRLGNARRVLGDLPASELAYGRALELAPNDIEALISQAEVATQRAGSGPIPAIAVANYERINKLDGSHLDALWYLGLAASERGEIGVAQQFWQRLLERLPTDSADARAVKSRIDALGGGD